MEMKTKIKVSIDSRANIFYCTQGIIVDTVFIGVSNGNEILQDLTEQSQGQWCIMNDVTDTSALSECFIGLAVGNNGNEDSFGDVYQVNAYGSMILCIIKKFLATLIISRNQAQKEFFLKG